MPATEGHTEASPTASICLDGCFPSAVAVCSSCGMEVSVGGLGLVPSGWHSCPGASCAADHQRLTSAFFVSSVTGANWRPILGAVVFLADGFLA